MSVPSNSEVSVKGIGRSTLTLVFSYREDGDGEQGWLDGFEARLHSGSFWRRTNPDHEGLLPHLDSIKAGGVFRVFQADGKLPNFFSGGTRWTFCDVSDRGRVKEELPVLLPRAPRLYVFESGYVFVALEVLPVEDTLPSYLDLAGKTVRGRFAHITPASLPEKALKWAEIRSERFGEPEDDSFDEAWSLRRWIAALLPGTSPEPPPGGRRRPVSLGVVHSSESFSPEEKVRLRLVLKNATEASVDAEEAENNRFVWRISERETGLACPYGFTWLVEGGSQEAFESRRQRIRTKYLFKWLLVEHQRLILLDFSTRCARLAQTLDPEAFDELRVELLRYSARFNFSRISEEPRQEAFYEFLRDALDVEALFAEVKEEITETSDHLQTKRSERLNVILSALTFVAAPLGLVVGVFQRETLPPGAFGWSSLASLSAWERLLGHAPAQLALVVVIGGVFSAFLLAPPSWLLRTKLTLKARIVRKGRQKAGADSENDRDD